MNSVNLIPNEQRRAKASGEGSGKGAYVVVGLLAVFLVMAVAYVLTSNKVNENQSKAAAAEQQAIALEAQAAQLGSFTNFASIHDQRLASVVATAETRFDWERLMREVSLIMPEGSWLQKTQASVLGDPVNAGAQAAAAATGVATGPVTPAANFVGCTKKQSEVAKLMVRMREMHRATDVKLNQSSVSTDGGVTDAGSRQLRQLLPVRRDRVLRAGRPAQGGAARFGPRARFARRWIMSLSDRDRKLLLAIVPIAVIAAFWFLVLAPKREEAAKAEKDAAKQEQRASAAQAQVDQAQAAETDFAADYGEIVRLGKAIPAGVDMPSLIVQLDAAAEGTSIRFTKIATGQRSLSAAPAPAPAPPAGGAPAPNGEGATPAAAGGQPAQSAPGTAAEAANTTAQTADQRAAAAEQSGVDPADTQTSTTNGEGGLAVGGGATTPAGTEATAGTAPVGLETVPLELEFTGDFFNLADFFHDMKRFVQVVNNDVVVSGRLVTIESVNYSSDPLLFPKIKAELKATVYLSPKAEGATAGASPQGPPETTPASAPATPDGTTPAVPAPTAAATP